MRSETRHQLKQDQFAQTIAEKAGTTWQWAAENRSRVITWGGGVVIVLLLVLGGWMYLRQQEQHAALALAQAMSTYQAPVVPAGTAQESGIKTFASEKDRSTEANKEFRQVADKYSTNSGKVARYMAGLTSFELGDAAEAEKQLKEVVGKGDKELSSLANLALASVYRQTNRADDALKIYQQLSDHPTRSVSKTAVQLEMASVYAARNENDKAKGIYEELAKGDAASVGAQIAKERLAGLGKQ